MKGACAPFSIVVWFTHNKTKPTESKHTMSNTTVNEIQFTRLNNDINGNPRYAFHFLNLASDYETALKKAKEIGGRKYHNKKYGGGIVIQSYNLERDAEDILKLAKQ